MNNMEIGIKDNYLAFKFDFDQDIIQQVKSIGMRWSPARKIWWSKITKISVVSFLKLFPEFYEDLKDYIPKTVDYSEYIPSDYLMHHQGNAAEIAIEKSRYCWWHGIGCHGKGTKILMANGDIKNIEDIKIKDWVIGPDSLPKEVKKLYQGQENLYQVLPIKGDSFVVNESHILCLRKWRHLWKRHEIEFTTMVVRDYLKLPEWYKKNRLKLYRSEAIDLMHGGKELPIDPYFLGILLGDGGLFRTPNVTTADPEIVTEIYKQAKNLSLKVHEIFQKNNKSNVYNLVRIPQQGSNQLTLKLKELNLRKTSGTKFIPFIYKTASRDDRCQLLAGLLDSDGSLSCNTYDFVSKSYKLASDLVFVARSLGLAVCLKPKVINNTTYYRANISGNTDRIPCRLERKKASPRKQKKNPLVTGFKIVPHGYGDYYGFKIGGDHRYLLGDFTVTHNTGKTILSIELMKQKNVKTLVVCPLSILEETWMLLIEEFDPERFKHTINLWALKQKNSPKARRLYFKRLEECKTAIINFESFRSIQKDLEQAEFRMLLVDESTCIKNNTSKITEAVLKFSENMDFVYPLSGNPAPNSEKEYWSQTQLIDPTLFGINFYAFRAKYFYSHGYGNFDWAMKEDKREEFLTKLASISDVVRKEDVLDLPEKTENTRKIYLNTLERKAYEDMKKHLVIEFGDQEVIAVNAGVKLMKLREGTSGFYINQKEEIIHVGDSKLNELEKLLEEIGNNQVIIWTHFHYEADQIEKLFGKIIKTRPFFWGRVDGTIKNRDVKNQRIRAFKNKELQYLVAHPGSLGRGHNLANCTYMIFFSISHSYDFFDQCSGRIYRKGQNNKCSFYFLIADRSVDEVILKTVLAKGNVVEAVFEYIKRGGK